MRGFGKKILFDKRYRLLAHILFWCLYYFVFCLASTNGLNNLKIGAETALLFTAPNLLYVINFLFRYYVLLPIRDHHPPPAHPFEGASYHEVFAMFSFVVMNTVAMFGVFIRMFKFWYLDQEIRLCRDYVALERERYGDRLDLSLRDDQLFFRVINSRQPEAPTGNGLGIANVRKRLALLYPGRSTLTAYPKEDVFISTLEINLCPSAA